MHSLGLEQRALFDLVGYHFDVDALIIRLPSPLRRWQEGIRPRQRYVHPGQLLRIYNRIRGWVEGQVCPAEGSPFPADLHDALLAAGVDADASQDVVTTMAAEAGRVGV